MSVKKEIIKGDVRLSVVEVFEYQLFTHFDFNQCEVSKDFFNGL
jgi:hypothetical protein